MATVPEVPELPVGYVVQAADLNDLVTAAAFLMTKPFCHVTDVSGGGSIPAVGSSSSGTVVPLLGVTAGDINDNVHGYIDTDTMSQAVTTSDIAELTVQTQGWYRAKGCVKSTTTSGSPADWIEAWLLFTPGNFNPLFSAYPDGIAMYRSQSSFDGSIYGVFTACGGLSPFPMYAGDTISLMAFCDTGSVSTNVSGSGGAALEASFIEAEWVSSI